MFRRFKLLITVDSLIIGQNFKSSKCYSSIHTKNTESRKMSRFSANTIMKGSDIFQFSGYDCIGFDLDGSLCHYNVSNKVKLSYEILSRFLVERKNYDPSLLYKPLEDGVDYLQKGLILDLKKGNILKLDDDGLINKARHGLKWLSEDEIVKIYGPNKAWECATDYVKNMLEAWNGQRSEEIRGLLDYFDLPSSLCFARCVETADKQGHSPHEDYQIWPDILEGLISMYDREHFKLNKGDYFSTLKSDPDRYYKKCSTSVIRWLKELKRQNKITFLVTGSNMDYGNLTASYCIGPDWKELFDVIIFYGRKPGFFIGQRPFYKVSDHKEIDIIPSNALKLGNGQCYSQGNWDDLYQLFKVSLGIDHPKCLYIGDNLIQDIYAPTLTNKCHTVAIKEEMAAEGIKGNSLAHVDSEVIKSNEWGSYFSVHGMAGVKIPTLWCDVIRKHSKICIPSLEVVANLPLDHEFYTFSEKKFCTAGFYPNAPCLFYPP